MSSINLGTIIGRNSILSHNIHIYHRTEIGEKCIIHSGAVIGSDGFGFYTNEKKHIKIPQNGKVVIGKSVEIGANCTFDRGTIENTIIKNFNLTYMKKFTFLFTLRISPPTILSF